MKIYGKAFVFLIDIAIIRSSQIIDLRKYKYFFTNPHNNTNQKGAMTQRLLLLPCMGRVQV